MNKLTALRKQIAALEAQAERIAKAEMSSAIARVKEIMAEFNLTIEHLTQTSAGKSAGNKSKPKTKSAARYADPKTGKTWTGVGRAPAWIAGARDRDAFLVGSASPAKGARVATAAKKSSTKVAKVGKTAKKPATKRVAVSAKKASESKVAPPAAKKRPAVKKAAAKKAASKRATRAKRAAATVEASQTPAV